MNNHALTQTTIGKAKVVVDILPFGKNVVNKKLSSIKYITIHDTGNTGIAKNQHNYMKTINNDGTRKASWHISCDDTSIYQAVRFDIRTLHAGTTNGNNNSISIEISQCSTLEKQKQAYLNAIELCKILMKEYNIPLSNIVQHNYWSGKNCPYNLRINRFGLNWTWFKNSITSNSVPNSDAWVIRLQQELNNLGYKDKNNNKLVEDGIKGQLTLSACPTVKLGDRNNLVKLIQVKVKVTSDGIFGKDTKNAIISYQKANKLEPDGIVGKNTWSKMLNM